MDRSAPSSPPPVVPGLTGLTVLARGGYATVYQAMQESVGREVAVKVENRALDSERDQRRFLREARAAGRMSSHPHVVDLFDAGMTADGHPYLIMELCDGSYADRMRTLPLTAAEVREVGVKIADALADAHALGVLHRDVKPANILFSRFGEPALADFGLAVLAESRDTLITLEVLTPAYAPREMFRAGTQPSPAADVYSLCATLYALLRGRPARWHDGQNPSLMALMELFDLPVPDLHGIPAVLLDALRSGMVNEPGERPTALMLRDRLAALELPSGTSGAPGPFAGTAAVAGVAPVVFRAPGAGPATAAGGAPHLVGPPALDAVTMALSDGTAASSWAEPTQALAGGAQAEARLAGGEPGRQGGGAEHPPALADAEPTVDSDSGTASPDREPGAGAPHRRWSAGTGAAVLVLGLLVGGASGYGPAHRPHPAGSPPGVVRPAAPRGTARPACAGLGLCP